MYHKLEVPPPRTPDIYIVMSYVGAVDLRTALHTLAKPHNLAISFGELFRAVDAAIKEIDDGRTE
jgi:hypothetical protein